ncbi:polyphenol oxidase family protein [bacterium]|nr:polyphenol oxidase family protein [bacterium]
MTLPLFSHAINEGRVRLHTHGPIPYITFSAFDSYPELCALTTLRNDNWLAYTTTTDILTAAGPFVAHVLGIPFQNLIAGKQVHGTNIFSFPKNLLTASPVAKPQVIPSTDGLLTNAFRMALIVVTADCLPVFLYDPKRSVIGLLHCGRAGTFDDIIGVGVQRMREDFASDPADCTAVIGPSVGPCCYDIDLWGANEHRLKELGVSQVFNCRVCSKCNNDLFYSYRAEKERAGRMVSAIALK